MVKLSSFSLLLIGILILVAVNFPKLDFAQAVSNQSLQYIGDTSFSRGEYPKKSWSEDKIRAYFSSSVKGKTKVLVRHKNETKSTAYFIRSRKSVGTSKAKVNQFVDFELKYFIDLILEAEDEISSKDKGFASYIDLKNFIVKNRPAPFTPQEIIAGPASVYSFTATDVPDESWPKEKLLAYFQTSGEGKFLVEVDDAVTEDFNTLTQSTGSTTYYLRNAKTITPFEMDYFIYVILQSLDNIDVGNRIENLKENARVQWNIDRDPLKFWNESVLEFNLNLADLVEPIGQWMVAEESVSAKVFSRVTAGVSKADDDIHQILISSPTNVVRAVVNWDEKYLIKAGGAMMSGVINLATLSFLYNEDPAGALADFAGWEFLSPSKDGLTTLYNDFGLPQGPYLILPFSEPRCAMGYPLDFSEFLIKDAVIPFYQIISVTANTREFLLKSVEAEKFKRFLYEEEAGDLSPPLPTDSDEVKAGKLALLNQAMYKFIRTRVLNLDESCAKSEEVEKSILDRLMVDQAISNQVILR